MPENQIIDVPSETAIARRETGPLSVAQVASGLKLIHDVMKQCMEDGKDYGKVPGCGDKPGLFQPGAQKLSMMFQLNPEVKEEKTEDYGGYHRGYRLVVRVTNGSKFADGVGECSTLESKYRYRNSSLKCPSCGKEAVLKSKNPGEGWFCWAKKGGCGAKFAPDAEAITSQNVGKVENENPADHWNTVRKMAFKRAFVHAIINATNTSELWSQDLEDLAGNGVVSSPETSIAPPQRPEAPASSSWESATPAKTPQNRPEAPKTTPAQQNAPTGNPGAKEQPSGGAVEWWNVVVPFGKNKGKKLDELTPNSLTWYIEKADLGKDTPFRRALDAAKAEQEANARAALAGMPPSEDMPPDEEPPF